MIRSIEIRNFRGVKECKVEDFALVNIFIGENNSGKSTVLDAIYLVCKEIIDQNKIGEILKRRVQRDVGGSELWYEYDSDKEISIDLVFNGSHWGLTIYRTGHYIRRKCKHPAGVIEFGSQYVFSNLYYYGGAYHNVLEGREQERKYFENLRMFYSLYREDELRKELDDLIGRVLQNVELEEDLYRRAKEVYGDLSVSFLPRRENPSDRLLAIKQEGYRIFADFFGDGIKRGLLILAALEVLKDTGLLIEEVETNQHPRALKNLAKHMVDLARKNNVQLFITTHSYYDALRYFYYAFEDEERRKNEFRCFLFKKHEGVVEVEIKEDIEGILRELYS